ncbi:ORF67 [Ostreid herpesvirus 1]|nr:ORF67 [Ostreid herpesvirus 1]UCX57169.1 ORF67 [Ostreid herpesvirus 1]
MRLRSQKRGNKFVALPAKTRKGKGKKLKPKNLTITKKDEVKKIKKTITPKPNNIDEDDDIGEVDDIMDITPNYQGNNDGNELDLQQTPIIPNEIKDLFMGDNWRKISGPHAVSIITKPQHRRYIALKGTMGTGKTHVTVESLNKITGSTGSILLIVGRKELANEIERRINGSCKVYNYLEKEEFSNGISLSRGGLLTERCVFIVCVNSITTDLFKEDGFKTEMIVVDEVETTFMNIVSESLMTYSAAIETRNTLVEKLFPYTNVLLTIDAALAEPMVVGCAKMFGGKFEEYKLDLVRIRPPIYHRAVQCSTAYNIIDHNPLEKRYDTLFNAITYHVYELGKRIVISVPYHKTALQLKRHILAARPQHFHKIPHVVVYTAKTRDARLARIKALQTGEQYGIEALAKEADVFIFNSCMSAGHSLNMDGYEACFSYFLINHMTCSVMEQLQMTARLRNNNSKTLYWGLMNTMNDPLRGIRDIEELKTYSTMMRKFGKWMGSSFDNGIKGFKILLKMAYPNIVFEKGVVKSREYPYKNNEIINQTMQNDASVLRKLFINPEPSKWRFVTQEHEALYGKDLPPRQFNYYSTLSGLYNVVLS